MAVSLFSSVTIKYEPLWACTVPLLANVRVRNIRTVHISLGKMKVNKWEKMSRMFCSLIINTL